MLEVPKVLRPLTTWCFLGLDLNMTRESGIASAPARAPLLASLPCLRMRRYFGLTPLQLKTTSVLKSGAASCSNNERVGGGK